MVSNVLGTVVDVAKVAQLVHQYDGILVVDAAQAVAHLPMTLPPWMPIFSRFPDINVWPHRDWGALWQASSVRGDGTGPFWWRNGRLGYANFGNFSAVNQSV